ncbi:MAG: RnfABCDGE type electron transport complex subunit G [Clostridiales bacterium]|nr:RnfABCDGE type electron transport complex subunit G [Clostridiales bacterium]
MQNSKGAFFFLRIGGMLLLITAIIAGLLAGVNLITQDKIEENQQNQINDLISALYEGQVEKETVEGTFGDTVKTVYRVFTDGNAAGYCFHVESIGYGGVMGLMVGFDTQGKVCGVKILEIHETAGLGSRVDDEAYLTQYTGMAQTKSSEEIDVLTGATISSKAVLQGMNDAIEGYAKLGGEADE